MLNLLIFLGWLDIMYLKLENKSFLLSTTRNEIMYVFTNDDPSIMHDGYIEQTERVVGLQSNGFVVEKNEPVMPCPTMSFDEEKKNHKFLIRASSVSNLMTNAKEEGSMLSATAKSMIARMADEYCYQTPIIFSNKYTEKGIIVEDESIELYNTVHFDNLRKNQERRDNGFVTGEPDLIGDVYIVDIKSSYTLETFARERYNSKNEYQWQLRTYLWLFNKGVGWTAHTLVNTPEHIARYEAKATNFDHIPLQDRVIIGNLTERDTDYEEQIQEKWYHAKRHFWDIVEVFKNEGRRIPLDLVAKIRQGIDV